MSAQLFNERPIVLTVVGFRLCGFWPRIIISVIVIVVARTKGSGSETFRISYFAS